MSIMLRPKLWTERHSESRSDMAIARAGDRADGVEVPSPRSAGALLLRLLHAFRHAAWPQGEASSHKVGDGLMDRTFAEIPKLVRSGSY